MALADIEGDGDLDLYVTNYRTDTYKDRPPGLNVEGRIENGKVVVSPADRFVPLVQRSGGLEVFELGERDFLYLNDGKGSFAPASWTNGAFVDIDGKRLAEPPKDWGLSVMFRDMDDDGAPDLYVCNDFFYSPDRVWMNKGGNGFRAIEKTALRNMSLASMAVDFADIDRDGFDDFFVVDMLSRDHSFRQRQRPNMMKGLIVSPIEDPNFSPEVARNTLYLNRGDGSYAEIAQLSGVAATEWSWGAIFLDVDLDGLEDLLVATGNSHDVQDADAIAQVQMVRENETPLQRMKRFPPLETENLAFRNRGDLTFEEVSAKWGFNLRGISHGMALGDLDNDGDLDVAINNLNIPAGIFRNDAAGARVAVRLKGAAPNTAGIGAKIRVLGGPVKQSQEMISAGRYLSSDDAERVFAAGSATNRVRIEVKWRSGKTSVVEGAEANRIYEIAETGAVASLTNRTVAAAPLFEDVSHLLQHTNVDESFDDFGFQPLLPRKLSSPGPMVAWIDFDADGFQDLVIAGSRSGKMALFRNNGHGAFGGDTSWNLPVLTRDHTSVVGWRNAFIAASSNYEDLRTPSALQVYSATNRSGQEIPLEGGRSVEAMAVGDFNLDGEPDLFVAGRAARGRYPEPASGHIYVTRSGKLEIDSSHSDTFKNVGMVTGAIAADLNGDKAPDLVLSCDWGPIKVFQNERGRFRERTRELGLDKYVGWWNGAAVADVNGDGKLDIVAANWGRNTPYQDHIARPLRTYYGDYDQNGRNEIVEAVFDLKLAKYVPVEDFETISQEMPFVRERFSTFRAFGSASVEEILGDRFKEAKMMEANTLESMVFLNRGDRLEGRPFPIEAQFAPAFGICISDFDGDAKVDIFLAQNFFGVKSQKSRYDGGVGLLLKGQGTGDFSALSATESGIRLFGQQRGCAAGDFDKDGRIDLVVSQNNGPTKLYRNRGGRHP
jgi:enediyne biosynthesis protein E4